MVEIIHKYFDEPSLLHELSIKMDIMIDFCKHIQGTRADL